MHNQQVTAREKVFTQAGAMNEDAGRLVANEAVQFAGICGASLVVGCVCVIIALGSAQVDSYAPAWLWTLSTFGMWFGALGALFAIGFGGVVGYLTVRGWFAYQSRLAAWHTAHVEAYKAAGGQQTERQVTISALSLSEPLHVLAVALAVVERHQETGAVTWSGPKLQGKVTLGHLRLGELGKSDAERFSAALGQLGLVKGRAKGYAGELATVDAGEVLQLVKKNYGKLRPGEVVRPELEEGNY